MSRWCFNIKIVVFWFGIFLNFLQFWPRTSSVIAAISFLRIPVLLTCLSTSMFSEFSSSQPTIFITNSCNNYILYYIYSYIYASNGLENSLKFRKKNQNFLENNFVRYIYCIIRYNLYPLCIDWSEDLVWIGVLCLWFKFIFWISCGLRSAGALFLCQVFNS